MMDNGKQLTIKVIGVGGGGGNALMHMHTSGVDSVELIIANTDEQAMNNNPVEHKIVLGETGLGAGGKPEAGREAAIYSEKAIKDALVGSDMVFVTAGMGGGTGTGAAPIVAKIARDMGALTVGVVSTPFTFEGKKRTKNALEGLEEFEKNVDSLIIVSNNKLADILGNIPVQESFFEADKVLIQGVQTITDIILVPSYVNLDFADVVTTMKDKGAALIGIGVGEGENKAQDAARHAIASPLLEQDIRGAKNAIINITGGPNMTFDDANIAISVIEDYCMNDDIDVIFGTHIDETFDDSIIVTVIATGLSKEADHEVIEQSVDQELLHSSAEEAFKEEIDAMPQATEEQTQETQGQDLDIPMFLRNR